ncbi:TPA: glycosyltransferase family 2 protein [Streptococcus agalactiae]|nr:glycosyltransferase family 2 protein [Streptococcus agalactiae]
MENILISIIIPIYNVEKFLEECIDSVLNQTYKNIEILLVDDGSTDNSGIICDNYSLKDKRIRVFHKNNGGLSDARNFGVVNAEGRYISFIDSDDYIDKNYIRKMYYCLSNHKVDMVICNYLSVYNNDLKPIVSRLQDCIIYSRVELFSNLYGKYKDPFTTAWGSLIRTDIAKKVTFPIGKLHEDEFTTYKYYLYSDKIAFVPEPLYFYRRREASIMSSSYSKRNLDSLEVYEERIKILEKNNISISETVYIYLSLILYHIYRIRKYPEVCNKQELLDKFNNYYLKYKNILGLKNRLKIITLKNLGIPYQRYKHKL